MKSDPVVDKKAYIAVTGEAFERKRDAEKVNIEVAREESILALLLQYFTITELSTIGIDELVEFLSSHGDEVIEVLEEREE